MADVGFATDIEKDIEIAEGNVEEEDGSKSPSTERKKIRKSAKKIKKPKEWKFDWPKKNYFEVTREQGVGLKYLVHRFVYIAKLRDNVGDRDGVGDYYERLLKNIQNNTQTEPVTGLLLVYMKHLVHIVETSTDVITEIVQDLKESEESVTGIIATSKILQWSFRTLDIQAARMEAYESSQPAEQLVLDLLTQVLKLGNFLAKTPKLNLKNVMDSLHEKAPDLLPNQAIVNYLLEENDSCMVRPEEYLSLYEEPYDVVLDSVLSVKYEK
ncbi:hypothetical protein KUTeg_003767, partial [Tegillarca granosa]